MKNLRKVWAGLVFAVVAGIGAGVVSCDNPSNPFKTSMGEKVPIERPTITVTYPATSSFIKDTITIKGTAAAYRQLGDVRIKIDSVIDEFKSLKSISGGALIGNNVKEKPFEYTLDTTQLPDGFLRVQFQVTDPDYTVDSNEYLYIVKNGPSEISMTGPDVTDLYTVVDAESDTRILSSAAEIYQGNKLMGTVYDRRGIKPGYPKIQIWKEGDPVPNLDPVTGKWARLFISNVDGMDSDNWVYDLYKDRSSEPVDIEYTFAFGLFDYTVNSQGEVVYARTGGKYTELGLGTYYFKILTSDTFFEETLGAENFRHPRLPKDGEKEIIVYEPDESIYPDSYHTFKIVPKSGENIIIDIDNSDLGANSEEVRQALAKQPHIYIEKESSEKIVVSPLERGPGPHADFRLRVNIYRLSGIDHAVLEWSHPQKGRGTLPWDDPVGSNGYVDGTSTLSKGTKGHKGIPNYSVTGVSKIFQFTGFTDTVINQDGVGGPVTVGDIFTSSSRDYTLTITAYITAAGTDTPEKREYFLALDDDGPDVEVRDIKGKSASPSAGPDEKEKGGTINKNFYTVNDNIQVTQSSTAERNIRIDELGNRVIKYFVEDATGTDPDASTDANVLLNKIKKFRSAPTSIDAQAFLEYFRSDAQAAGLRARGQVASDGTFTLNVDTRNIVAGEKTGTNALNHQYLWLYIVAQDGLYNLGYTLQKLYVDDDGDFPVVEIIGDRLLAQETGGPANTGELFPPQDGGNPVNATVNILGVGEAIDLSIADDDGLRPAADPSFPNDKLVTITLTSDNFPGVTGDVDIVELMGSRVFQSNDTLILTQTRMAAALISGLQTARPATATAILQELYGSSARTYLPDGVYTLTIKLPDAQSQKVKIGSIDPVSVTTTRTYHFAVQSQYPVIDLTGELENGYMSSGAKDVTGTVSSRLQIQKLAVTFDPNVLDPAAATTVPTLTPVAGSSPDNFGNYTYEWNILNVDFTNNASGEQRRLSMAAWDKIGTSGVDNRTLYIDSKPPDVSLYAFNFGRNDPDTSTPPRNRVNGKVPIEIETSDENGIGEFAATDAQVIAGAAAAGDPAIRWVIALDTNNTVFNFDSSITQSASLRSGYFKATDFRGGARYRVIINTAQALTANGYYKVFVFAKDKAGNASTVPTANDALCRFIVVQSTDTPILKSLSPEDGVPLGGANATLAIAGAIADDDRFDPLKQDSYVQILFPNFNPTTGAITGWGTNWLTVPATIDSVSGDLNFKFDFNVPTAARPEYLRFDGEKRYRLRIKDEADRGAGPDLMGAYSPEGKNPDRYSGQGVEFSPRPAGYVDLAATQITLPAGADAPGATTAYSFFFKNDNPKVYFDKYDPTQYDDPGNPTANPPVPPSGPHPSYSAKRPVYAGDSTQKQKLLADLQGTIVDRSLSEASFSYGAQSHPLVVTTTDNNTHYWNVTDIAWLAAFDGPEEQGSITILATDTLGNKTTVIWTFFKDVRGPTISYDNISPASTIALNNARVVTPDSEGKIKITGVFTDTYSPIDETFDYRLGSPPASGSAWVYQNWVNNYNIVTNGGTLNPDSNSATWTITIDANGSYNGAFPDGLHSIRVRARDEWKNSTPPVTTPPTEPADVYFIIDRQAPQMLEKNVDESSRLRVTGNGLVDAAGAAISRPLPEVERVFSAANLYTSNNPANGLNTAKAASATKVFTLSGMVYEHNLTTLSASIRNGTNEQVSVTMPSVDALGIAWKNGATSPAFGAAGYVGTWGNGTGAQNLTDANFRIRQAVTADLTTFSISGGGVTANNRYVWELDVLERDFYALLSDQGADNITRSILVTARDRGSFSGRTESWQFYLDSNGPTITFSNISNTDGATVLQDPEIVLKGTVTDLTSVRKIQYKLEKWNYATSAFTALNADGDGFTDYTGAVSGTRVSMDIEGAIAAAANDGDGQYRITLRAYDYSLSAAAGGNPTLFPAAPSLGRTFYVDRADPEIKWGSKTEPEWGTPVETYYRWANDTTLTFDFTVLDDNAIQTSPAPSAVLYPVNNPAGAYPITTVPITVALASTPSPLSPTRQKVTVTITKANTLAINGRHTLEITIRDSTGKKATSEQTKNIYLDNAKPILKLEPAPASSSDANAIVGRVEFRGDFSKELEGSSPIKRVAFQVTTSATAPTVPVSLSDDDLKAGNWFYNDSSNGAPFKLWAHRTSGVITNTTPAQVGDYYQLMEIFDGLAKPNLYLYDTRRFNAIKASATTSTLLGAVQKPGTGGAPAAIKWNSDNLATTDDVHLLRIWLLAIDEAGNYDTKSFDYWVYPAGDYPSVAITTPDSTATEAERQLNGTIKLQGRAEDNYRVSNVWFRVLKDGYTGAAIGGSVPAGYEIVTFNTGTIDNWNDNWEASGKQTPASKTFRWKNASGVVQPTAETSGGWYRANISVIAKSVPSWYAQVNSGDELNPTGSASSRGIIVQTLAEDAILNDNGVGYNTSDTLFSIMEETSATVVSDRPSFTGEGVKSVASSDTTVDWANILSSAVTGRSAYRVTVRHNAGLGAVRWTNGSAAGVSSVANLLDGTQGSVATYGIEAKAAPKDPKTGTVALAAGTYLIWEPLATIPTGSGVTAGDNKRHTVFSISNPWSGSIGSGVLLEQQTDLGTGSKYFEWLVTIDLNTETLGYTGQAGYYDVNLEAHDNSKTVALFQRKTASIPIDNLPPEGAYTYTTNVAGSNAEFGGEAGDAGDSVKGLARVVLWFSRNTGTNEESIVWNGMDPDGGAAAGVNQTFNSYNPTGTPITVHRWVGTKPTTVVVPVMPDESLTVGSNNSCIVIDRQDPMGNQQHHGHYQQEGKALPMGWSAGGAMETSWYVSLDSRRIESGRVTAHFIVIDRAGNATYYNQKLMILNGVAKIRSVTLATDIYGAQSPLNLQAAHNTWGTTTNLKFGAGSNLVTTGSTAINRSAMDDIRARYTNVGKGDDYSDEENGISEEIFINTASPGVYSVVFDQNEFVARNSLLAVKVDTDIPMSSKDKDRYFRVEYVSGAVAKSGANANTANSLTNASTGVRAGRVYIINNVGTNFPWGVLGAQGETYRRGTVFLAMQDGSEMDAQYKTGGYGTPSVWELNSTYYRSANNPLTRTVPTALQFTNNTSDVQYNRLTASQSAANELGKTAEFVYRAGAFGATAGSNIINFKANADGANGTVGANLDALGRPLPYPASENRGTPAAMTVPWTDHSLFIIKIFDGPEGDLFGDFALLSIRVNNDDATPPYAQLYDLNPKAENDLDTGEYMGQNRAKGGVLNAAGGKSGHIEPRSGTSLTGAQMGGETGSGTISRPAAQPTVGNTRAYFETDTVSGDVIVRGYAEDNQRIGRVDLEFWSTANTPARLTFGDNQTAVTILERDATATNSYLVRVPTAIADQVTFTETVELSRHRVEWAYKWSSDALPGGNYVVGNYSVRAIAYNINSGIATAANNTTVSSNTRLHTSELITRSSLTATNRNTFDSFNPDYPVNTGSASTVNFYRYNDIRVNLRPYITGFMRSASAHNTRSRQGRYIFARAEPVIITGFNLRNGNGNTNIILPGTGTTRVSRTTSTPSTAQATANGLATADINQLRHRYFTLTDAMFTGDTNTNSVVTMTVNGYSAVNTPAPTATATNETAASIRPMVNSRPVVQPWNKEFSPGTGSELWDDYVMVHIWQSNDDVAGNTDRGRFAKGPNSITHPSMSINPHNGVLWSSHQEGGIRPANTPYPGGANLISSNDNNTATHGPNEGVMQTSSWSEHQSYTSIFVSGNASGDANYTLWSISNLITKSHVGSRWGMVGGMWLWGPIRTRAANAAALAVNPDTTTDVLNGDPLIASGPRTRAATNLTATGTGTLPPNPSGFEFPTTPVTTGHYAVESLWYNGSEGSRTIAEPPNLEQFHNPHIVSYSPANTTGHGTSATTTEHVHVAYYDSKDGSLKYRYNNRYSGTGLVHNQASPRNWVNLDGGADVDDNAPAAGRPGSNASTDSNNYGQNNVQVRYPTLPAYNPTTGNGGTSGGTTANWAYTVGTTDTSVNYAANSAHNITAVRVQNGQYVAANEQIYTVSAAQTVNTTHDAGFVVLNYRVPTNNVASGAALFRIYPVDTSTTSSRILNASTRMGAAKVDAGRHNSIAVTSQGYPVIAYYDETNRGLKLAVSNNTAPTTAANWKVFTTTEVFGASTGYATGTGEYVSIQIDTRAGATQNTFHIAAMNAVTKNVVYITGTLNVSGTLSSYTLSNQRAQIVDSVGNVGNWCKLSLDSSGRPWIAYMDDGYRGSRDGVKVAFLNTGTFYKGGTGNYDGQDLDPNGTPISGWEAMHVPTGFRVESNQLGMERYPTIRVTNPTARTGLANFGAVGYLGEDYYRVAYYVD